MKKLALFALTLTVALPFVSARPAAAAAQENVIAQATGDKQPFALAWYDDAQGTTTKIDSQMSQKLASAFAGAQYLITDQHHLLIGQVSGSNVQTIVPPAAVLDVSDGKGYYVVHLRAPGVFLNGIVIQFSDDPTQGLAVLDLVLVNQQGSSESTHIEQSLTWSSGGKQTPPSDFGF